MVTITAEDIINAPVELEAPRIDEVLRYFIYLTLIFIIVSLVIFLLVRFLLKKILPKTRYHIKNSLNLFISSIIFSLIITMNSIGRIAYIDLTHVLYGFVINFILFIIFELKDKRTVKKNNKS